MYDSSMTTSTKAPAATFKAPTDTPVPAPNSFTFPTYTEGDPILPKGPNGGRGRQAKPNPFDQWVTELATTVDEKGFSKSRSFVEKTPVAKLYVSMIRRAATVQGFGVASPTVHDEAAGTSTVVVGLIPKRERKSKVNAEITNDKSDTAGV